MASVTPPEDARSESTRTVSRSHFSDHEDKSKHGASFHNVGTSCHQQPAPLPRLLTEPALSDFWTTLEHDIIHQNAWRVEAFDESSAASLDEYSDDVRHYTTPEGRIHMKHRRKAAVRLRRNPERWSRLVLAGLRELATNSPGPATATLRHAGLFSAFQDFAVHIHYFQVTKKIMESAGVVVSVSANGSSSVHDVDKLDPIMLVGYCERWEDIRDTALWRACLESHYALNTHHQQNELWHYKDGEKEKQRECHKALPELLCDKSSRCLQKELNGIVSSKMWSVEPQFYLGMPEEWFDRARAMAVTMADATTRLDLRSHVT